MNEVLKVLTSTECIIIYIITFVLCLISFIIYKFDSGKKDLRRKKHNTKELNKLVDEIEEYDNIDSYEDNQVPVIQSVNSYDSNMKDDLINKMAPSKKEVEIENKQETLVEEMVNNTIKDEKNIQQLPKKMDSKINMEVSKNIDDEFEDEFEYTTIEPNREEAKKELLSLTKKLEMDELKKEQFFNEDNNEEPIIEEVNNNIDLNKYEEEQEENSIISLEELNNKGKEIYELNEINQYIDEGNEPITLKDLEIKMNKQLEIIAENFEIDKVAEKPSKEEINEMLEGLEVKKMKMDDFNSINTKKYHPSPVISPIFGLEKNDNIDLELENTADYEKLDQEIKKTNEFLMSMKELQEHINN